MKNRKEERGRKGRKSHFPFDKTKTSFFITLVSQHVRVTISERGLSFGWLKRIYMERLDSAAVQASELPPFAAKALQTAPWKS